MNRQQIVTSLLSLILSLSITGVYALPNDNKQTMHITSDASNVDKNAGIATFIGHVQFIQGSLKVLGNKMVVYFDKNSQMEKAVVTGSADNLAEAWTQPQIDKPVLHVKALTINYNTAKHTIDLIGDAQAEQNGNVLKGPSLTYDTQTQVLTTLASPNGRTTIVIQPQNNNTKDQASTSTASKNTETTHE